MRTVSMSCLKRQKHLENYQEMDSISNLPDALLCHILSLVPTKSAVATSILSKRWISLWTKVPVLDFTETRMLLLVRDSEKKRYLSFIRKVLCHNDIPCLQRLHFDVLNGLYTSSVKSLLNSVLKHEIREIHLIKEWAGPDNVPMKLPTALFIRDRLVILKLKGPFDVSIPSSLHLPRLETLHLYELEFVGEDVLKIDTSGYSSLKELVFEDCSGIKKLHIDLLTLNSLKTTDTWEMIVTVKGPNVRFLDIDCDTENYDIIGFDSLVEARISIFADEASRYPWALELLRRISNVQTLYFAHSTVELFGHVSENQLPIFPNLTRLEIQIEHSMFQMLKCAPKIMHLIVDVGISLQDKTRQFPSEIVPHCLLSLPTIEIKNYGGFENDTELIRYILKNATVLRELRIHMHEVSVKRERDAYKKLLGLPRFTSCSVIACSGCGNTTP